MNITPKIVPFKEFLEIDYPLGLNWNSKYPKYIAESISNVYKEGSITLVVRGTSGAMLAGAIVNELSHLNPNIFPFILVVRKPKEISHCSSLDGIEHIKSTKYIIVDDFIVSGETIQAILSDLDSYFKSHSKEPKTYDMLCINNFMRILTLMSPEINEVYKETYKEIYSRFNYIVCSPKQEETE
nr:MAG TPA: adenine/guanine phosphoribosyltransferase [Crassvirales sp.]